jgi:hypothetical protein
VIKVSIFILFYGGEKDRFNLGPKIHSTTIYNPIGLRYNRALNISRWRM